MKPNRPQTAILALSIGALILVSCTRKQALVIPEIDEGPEIEAAATRSFSDYAPGYGIAVGPNFEVNIESEDSLKIAQGQDATVTELPDNRPITCRVSRIIRNVSSETGHAIAWLTPTSQIRMKSGRFVSSKIKVGTKKRVVSLPESALFIRDGKTWVIRVSREKDKDAFKATPVDVDGVSDGLVFLRSGIAAGDKVVSQGGIGYVYPDFKASGEGD